MSDQSIYFSWRRNNPKELAQFVARSLPPELRLDKGINRADLLKSAGNHGLVREIYSLLSQLNIIVDVEPPDITPGIQQLRPPALCWPSGAVPVLILPYFSAVFACQTILPITGCC